MTLSVPTVYLVIALNLVAVGIVWAFVARYYPKFPAAAVWAAGCMMGAVGAAISLLRGVADPLVPIIFGNTLLMLMTWFGWFGLRLFYGRSVPWLVGIACTAATSATLAVFAVGSDIMPIRIVVYSAGQAIPAVLMMLEILAHRRSRRYGDNLALGALAVVLALHVVRAAAGITEFGGPVTLREFNIVQGAMLVVLVFAAMVGNFAFLLMAMDRLREDVASLALSDDLTGVANRRHLFKRLADECALSRRALTPFAVLVMDLDEFKDVNDSHGHGAGDECLRTFCHLVRSRLRSSDLLARIGGDEFCAVLPRTTASEADIVAEDLVAICNRTQVIWDGVAIPLTASIGVAQWALPDSDTPERIMAAADQALYDAKRLGKNRHATHGDSQPLAPAEAIVTRPAVSAVVLRSA